VRAGGDQLTPAAPGREAEASGGAQWMIPEALSVILAASSDARAACAAAGGSAEAETMIARAAEVEGQQQLRNLQREELKSQLRLHLHPHRLRRLGLGPCQTGYQTSSGQEAHPRNLRLHHHPLSSLSLLRFHCNLLACFSVTTRVY